MGYQLGTCGMIHLHTPNGRMICKACRRITLSRRCHRQVQSEKKDTPGRTRPVLRWTCCSDARKHDFICKDLGLTRAANNCQRHQYIGACFCKCPNKQQLYHANEEFSLLGTFQMFAWNRCGFMSVFHLLVWLTSVLSRRFYQSGISLIMRQLTVQWETCISSGGVWRNAFMYLFNNSHFLFLLNTFWVLTQFPTNGICLFMSQSMTWSLAMILASLPSAGESVSTSESGTLWPFPASQGIA